MYPVIIIAFCIIKEAVALNVALGKRGNLCNKVDASEGIFDGNRNISNLIVFDEKLCKGYTNVNVRLNGLFYVHYVIVYIPSDENLKDPKLRTTLLPLEYFNVYSLKIDDGILKEFPCSQFEKPLKDFKAHEGMRVNCRIVEQPTAAMRLTVREEPELELSEIEVHSLTSTNPEEQSIFYRGCFSKFLSDDQTDFYNLSSCISFCRNRHKPIMGIKDGKYCQCGVKYYVDDKIKSNLCDHKCELSRYCGGKDATSLYVVIVQLPSYYGCQKGFYKDSAISGVITIPNCLKACDNASYVWIKKDACGCLNDVGEVESTSMECNVPCSQDDEYCGGENYVSIYSTCYNELRLGCDLLFKCKKSFDKYGSCNKNCKEGFTGEYCVEEEIVKVIEKLAVEKEHLKSISAVVLIVAVVIFVIAIWKGYPKLKKSKFDKENPEDVVQKTSA